MLKALVQRCIPAPMYHYGSLVYRGGIECAKALHLAIRYGVPEFVLYFGVAPGDDLLCTSVLRELKKRGHGPLWMMSGYPDLYARSGDVERIVEDTTEIRAFSVAWKRLQLLSYAEFNCLTDRSDPPVRHIIAELCARVDIKGEIALRPYIYLTPQERTGGAWARDMIAIQSSGLAGKWPMQNKQWLPERFQGVVDRLRGDLQFVQMGSVRDPPLSGALDLRGKSSIRETASILSNCLAYVGNVGFLMHLARAVECPSIIVYGGREAPWQSGYSCNVNLYSAVPCAPCWLWNRCDHGKVCMEQITAEDVILGIKRALTMPRHALPVDYAVI